MNKLRVLKLLENFGDAFLHLDTGRSICVTTDFNNKHIKRVRKHTKFNLKGKVLVFNWTDYAFEAVPTDSIKRVTPLSQLLNNKRDPE